MRERLKGLYKKICSDMKWGLYFFISLLTLIFWLWLNFSSAEKIDFTVSSINYSNNNTWYINLDSWYIYCFYAWYNTSSRNVVINFQDFNWTLWTVQHTCFTPWDLSVEYIFNWTQFNQLNYYKLIDYVNLSDYELKSDITENYCTNKFSNLIDESDIDSSYCESNNLCSSVSTWDSNWSSLYINDIQHLGSSSIFITIPEEFNWYYNYLDSWMYIDIEGYNVDYDKINDIVAIQNYKPDSDDFSNLVKNVLPTFVPWLVIILFIYFIFRFIRKIFK